MTCSLNRQRVCDLVIAAAAVEFTVSASRLAAEGPGGPAPELQKIGYVPDLNDVPHIVVYFSQPETIFLGPESAAAKIKRDNGDMFETISLVASGGGYFQFTAGVVANTLATGTASVTAGRWRLPAPGTTNPAVVVSLS